MLQLSKDSCQGQSTSGLLSIDVSHGVQSPPTPPKTPKNQSMLAQHRHQYNYRVPAHGKHIASLYLVRLFAYKIILGRVYLLCLML